MLAGSLISASTKQSSWISNRNLFPEIGEPLQQWLHLAKYWGSAYCLRAFALWEGWHGYDRRKHQAMLREAFEPFVQFIPRTADSVSLTASWLEDDLKRFPLFAALTINRH
jgi:hypothetical protein